MRKHLVVVVCEPVIHSDSNGSLTHFGKWNSHGAEGRNEVADDTDVVETRDEHVSRHRETEPTEADDRPHGEGITHGGDDVDALEGGAECMDGVYAAVAREFCVCDESLGDGDTCFVQSREKSLKSSLSSDLVFWPRDDRKASRSGGCQTSGKLVRRVRGVDGNFRERKGAIPDDDDARALPTKKHQFLSNALFSCAVTGSARGDDDRSRPIAAQLAQDLEFSSGIVPGCANRDSEIAIFRCVHDAADHDGGSEVFD